MPCAPSGSAPSWTRNGRISPRPANGPFLCRYLHGLPLRHEIHEGLNVVEQWNSANDFVFFARKGELASNRREDHEISMLALHLLQNAMVYVNTLMIQHTLALPAWANRLTARFESQGAGGRRRLG